MNVINVFGENPKVILIGTSYYNRDADVLLPIPNVINNIKGLKDILLDNSVIGFKESDVVTVLNESSSSIKEKLHEIVDQCGDTLIVYYSGHGIRENSQLYLAGTDTIRKRAISTGIKFEDFSNIIKTGSGIKKKILILDCCYSGLAIGTLSDEESLNEAEFSQLFGSYILASSPSNKVSKFNEDNDYTDFTGVFLNTLSNGLSNGRATVTIDEIYENILKVFKTRRSNGVEVFDPKRIQNFDISSIPFAKNVAFSEAQKKIAKAKEQFKLNNYEEAKLLLTGTFELFPELIKKDGNDEFIQSVDFLLKASGKEIRNGLVERSREVDQDLVKDITVAIDFGTSYSAIGYYDQHKHVVLVPSLIGQKLVPSVVTFFFNGDYIVGERDEISSENAVTIKFIKKEIGRKRKYKVFGRELSAELICSLIIASLKKNAEEFLGCEVNSVLISKPANYSLLQTNALIECFNLAGLNVRRIIDEPYAACLVDYYLENKMVRNDKYYDYLYLTIDLGGGTLDLSLVESGDGVYEIKNVLGDNNLGGKDFDYCLFKFLLKECIEDYYKISDKVSFKRRLLLEAEKIKKILTRKESAYLSIDDIETHEANLIDINLEVSRDDFRKATKRLNKRIRELIEKLFHPSLSDYGYTKASVKKIVLGGQGCKIFTFTELVEELFPGVQLVSDYQENAVINGIALYSGVLNGRLKDVLLLSVNPIDIMCRYKSRKIRGELENTIQSHQNIIHDLYTEKGNIIYHLSTKENLNNKYVKFSHITTIPTKTRKEFRIDKDSDLKTLDLPIYEYSPASEDSSLLGCIPIPVDDIEEFFLELDIDANNTLCLKILRPDNSVFSVYQLNNFYNNPLPSYEGTIHKLARS